MSLPSEGKEDLLDPRLASSHPRAADRAVWAGSPVGGLAPLLMTVQRDQASGGPGLPALGAPPQGRLSVAVRGPAGQRAHSASCFPSSGWVIHRPRRQSSLEPRTSNTQTP